MSLYADTMDLYQRGEELRWQGDTDGARDFLKRAIFKGREAMESAKEPKQCQQASALLMTCIRMYDGLGAARR